MRGAFLIPIIVVLAFLAVVAISLLTTSEARFRGLGIVVIGPFPIIIDASDPAAILLLLIPFTLTVIALLSIFVMSRRKVRLQME